MHEHLDGHSTRLDAAEQRISDLENGGAVVAKHVGRVEWLLKTAAAKNYDLEACLPRNNIFIVAETTNTGPIG
ncbi:hypothetical protein NDU88_000311 [Pleurodeles waltl]|uniref:Uncharacterized protein n=1 Tax=Pleurodeles waltl TaxID=8319 RepID=A0AAV7URA6_PLEWA|nr:hypothetical protein NDU88_000311 [Pleurodeles waltl]